MARPIIKSIEERFWNKVQKANYCWNWIGYIHNEGYGRFAIKVGLTVLPHRFVYELIKGKIPDGLTIDHLCRNRKCVNPNHLEAVSIKENTLRGFGPAGINSRKTHCIHGHELSQDNVYLRPEGRRCKTCRRLQNKIRHQKIRSVIT